MVVASLLVLQALATAIGGAIVWRWRQALQAEISALRDDVRALEARAAMPQRQRKRAELGVTEAEPAAAAEPPLERARKRWRLPSRVPAGAPPRGDLAALRSASLAIAGAAPAFGLFFGIAPEFVISTGLFIAAGFVGTALRTGWPHSEWAGLGFSVLWCGFALGLGVSQTAPDVLAFPLATLAAAALVLGRLRYTRPSLAVAGIAAITMLAISWQTTFIGPVGLAFAVTAAAAAVIGAGSLRLEALFIGSFIASLAGLFGLSGQPSAAIWFTPAVALQGALFMAIAMVRVPQRGARGALVAGIAALGALGAALALHVSQHGLASNFAAAGVFVVIGSAFAGIIAMAAQRHERGHSSLKLTLWLLALSALLAFACAIGLAAPAPLAATVASLLALAAVALDRYRPSAAWRASAWLALALTLFHALSSARLLLSEASQWAPLALLAIGVVAPAIVAALAAQFAHRSQRVFTASVAEATAILLALAAGSLGLRLACAGGALLLTPVSFAEAGGHLALWLGFALGLGLRDRHGASALRKAAAQTLGAGAGVATAAVALLWLSDYWAERNATNGLISYEPLGFLLPALAAGAHWVFWRARDRTLQARFAFGLFAATAAGFAVLATLRLDGLSETARALACAGVIGLAIAVNFAPGVTLDSARATPLRRRRRRQLPQQA
jgi:hypothetical protein